MWHKFFSRLWVRLTIFAGFLLSAITNIADLDEVLQTSPENRGPIMSVLADIGEIILTVISSDYAVGFFIAGALIVIVNLPVIYQRISATDPITKISGKKKKVAALQVDPRRIAIPGENSFTLLSQVARQAYDRHKSIDYPNYDIPEISLMEGYGDHDKVLDMLAEGISRYVDIYGVSNSGTNQLKIDTRGLHGPENKEYFWGKGSYIYRKPNPEPPMLYNAKPPKDKEIWHNIKIKSEDIEKAISSVNGFTKFDVQVPIGPRISLVDFAKEAENRGWKILHPESLEANDIDRGLHQACVDGAISVWAREDDIDELVEDNPLRKMRLEIWDTHQIDFVSVIQFYYENSLHRMKWGENIKTSIKRRIGGLVDYVDVHLDTKQALNWLDTEAAIFKGKHDAKFENRQAGSGNSEYDIAVTDAVRYIVVRDWNNIDFDWLQEASSKVAPMYEALVEIRQKASDGKLVIYGTPTIQKSSHLVPIEKEYWRHYGFEIMGVLKENPGDLKTENKTVGNKQNVVYENLHTSRADVSKLWPPQEHK